MINDVDEVLLAEDRIAARVKELGAQISRDYKGKRLLLVGVLKGAAVFLADLARAISIPVTFDFMAVSSYGPSTHSSGVVRILKDLEESIEGRHVLVVEDVVDTGLTLKYIYDNLKARHPASLKICSLLDKPDRRKCDVEIHYVGFQIPDRFVVGYGLDYDEQYRNLPFVSVLKPEVYGK